MLDEINFMGCGAVFWGGGRKADYCEIISKREKTTVFYVLQIASQEAEWPPEPAKQAGHACGRTARDEEGARTGSEARCAAAGSGD